MAYITVVWPDKPAGFAAGPGPASRAVVAAVAGTGAGLEPVGDERPWWGSAARPGRPGDRVGTGAAPTARAARPSPERGASSQTGLLTRFSS